MLIRSYHNQRRAPMKADLADTSFLAKTLVICSISVPYLASSVFFFRFMINLCGLESLVLSGVAWLLGSAFAYFAVRHVMAETPYLLDDLGILLFLVCLLWTALWLIETALRAVIYKNSWTAMTCDSTSLTVLFAWVAGAVIMYLLTEAIVCMIQAANR